MPCEHSAAPGIRPRYAFVVRAEDGDASGVTQRTRRRDARHDHTSNTTSPQHQRYTKYARQSDTNNTPIAPYHQALPLRAPHTQTHCIGRFVWGGLAIHGPRGVDAEFIAWRAVSPTGQNEATGYTGLLAQCGHRYLAFLAGTTYSSRLKFQLLCGSTVLAAQPEFVEWRTWGRSGSLRKMAQLRLDLDGIS